jgi:hypothetical protein
MPRLREHWERIFEPITLELPKRPVPGRLTKDQAVAIQGLIDDAAAIVLDRLKHERAAALLSLVSVELSCSALKATNQAT